ncbi:GNAT family N-acetyltransferase [Brachybacterium sp. DNPG3]
MTTVGSPGSLPAPAPEDPPTGPGGGDALPTGEDPHAGDDPFTGAWAEDAVLDNPVWSALTGAHARFAIRADGSAVACGGEDLVLRYPSDISPFIGVRDWSHPGVWDALAAMVGPDAQVSVSHTDQEPPVGWSWAFRVPGVQLVATEHLYATPDPEVIELGAVDVPEMLSLASRTQPGPFLPRTHEMGRYAGIRREGRLVAMGGERLRPDGWTEISAVCVDPEHRRGGLASRIVLDVAFHILQRGDRPMLHAAGTNVGAIRAYEKVGFALRREVVFGAVRTPA